MILDTDQMKKIENDSKVSTIELIKRVAKASCFEIKKHIDHTSNILIVIGKGNNGSDGIFIADELIKEGFKIHLCPIIKENAYISSIDNKNLITTNSLMKNIDKYDVIVDCIFGISFYGTINHKLIEIFKALNESKAYKISIDINSGQVANDGFIDENVFKSDLTLAISFYKPCHLLNKETEVAKEIKIIDIGLHGKMDSNYIELDDEKLKKLLPIRSNNIYKNTNGMTLIVAGSKGYSGACIMNIKAAECTGNGFNHVLLDQDIYQIVASRCISPVFHFTYDTNIKYLIKQVNAICFGSGCVNMINSKYIFDLILQNCEVPLIWDGEAFNHIKDNLYLLRFSKSKIIMTPHIGEFARILNLDSSTVIKNKLKYAREFADKYNIILCLKGPNTIVVEPHGRTYINQSGNNVLAKAGSGDILTGLITGFSSQIKDTFSAVIMSVYLHGRLSDEAIKDKSYYSIQPIDILNYIDLLLK